METKLMVTQKAIYELAKSKGWWPRPFGESIALLHSELSEALEEWRDGHGFNEIRYASPVQMPVKLRKPEGIPIEMADFAIRLMDLAESEEVTLKSINYEVYEPEENFACTISGLHKNVSQLHQGRHGGWNYLWALISAVCKFYQIPLFRAINLKHAFNQTRDFRHGGKLA